MYFVTQIPYVWREKSKYWICLEGKNEHISIKDMESGSTRNSCIEKIVHFLLSLLESCKCILNVLKKNYLRIENLVWTGRSDYFIVYVIGEQERGAETCGRYMYMYLFSLDVIF